MKTVLKVLGVLVVLIVILGGVGFRWATAKTSAALDRRVETHTAGFPMPMLLDSAEIVVLGLSPEGAVALAEERAIARGEHLVTSRFGCVDCHGQNFGGGVMIDVPIMGQIFGPNLTVGAGGRTKDFAASDWDRAVRHGVSPDGRVSMMPSQDYQRMSDQELSDVIAYIRSKPPVDAATPPATFGPVGKMLIATGRFPLSADLIDQSASHRTAPPDEAVTVEFGQHIAGVCMGCHGADLSGGPVVGGDPAWPPASNLTPHPDALGAWTYQDFERAVAEGQRPDGSELREPMASMMSLLRNMTDVEREALWTYLRSISAVAPTNSN